MPRDGSSRESPARVCASSGLIGYAEQVAIATEFYNWQTCDLKPGAAPYSKCAPALNSLYDYLKERWGGKNLGCFNNRPIKGGTLPSSHAFGAARDWRYKDPGPGRTVAVNEILPFLINNSSELGIQAIHDYRGSRIWRANRSGDANAGWKQQPASEATGMGQEWANYFHIEVNRKQWDDGRSVAEKIGQPIPPVPPTPPKPPAPPVPPFDPAKGQFGLWPLNPNKPTVKRNSKGDAVRYLQGVLLKARLRVAVDGAFGPQTEGALRRFQSQRRLAVDGICGSQTWREIDKVATGR